nr:acyltransferase [Corynebacterium nuruki]
MVAPRPFLPALEGLRACAALGIVVTHVAFQTGNDTGALFNRILARFDFFVPVFFALSAFLLWRRHHDQVGDWAGYYVRRCGRILPAYWVVVAVVLLLLPVAGHPGGWPAVANILLIQNYLPDGLLGGLTHLWSLCVEMFFYLVLPVIAVVVGRRRRRVRVLGIVLLGLVGVAWPFLAVVVPGFDPSDGGVNPHIMPWAFFAWFGVGMLAAELEGFLQDAPAAVRDTARRWAGRRWLWLLVALAALVVAALLGPEGLTQATPWQFVRRNLCGLVFAAALVGPYVVEPAAPVLESPVMQALGRWSYSVFLWHIAVLSLVFPLLGIGLFRGGYLATAVVLVATVVFTVPVAAVSYALVEDPARHAVNRWWRRAVRADHADHAGHADHADHADRAGQPRRAGRAGRVG